MDLRFQVLYDTHGKDTCSPLIGYCYAFQTVHNAFNSTDYIKSVHKMLKSHLESKTDAGANDPKIDITYLFE